MDKNPKKEYLHKVKLLREQLCMGIQEGLDLLAQTEGDVEQASALFRQKMLRITTDFVKLPEESVLPYLEKYRYDAGRAIDNMLDAYRLVDGVPQSEGVYILHKFRNDKKEAIKKIAALIEKKEHLARHWKAADHHEYPTLDEAALLRLSEPAQCILALAEWLDYEDSEGFEAALFYLPDIAAAQMRLLGHAQPAAALLMARDIYKEHFAIHHHAPSLYKALNKDGDYQAARRYLLGMREQLTAQLYQYTAQHLDRLHLPE